MKINELEFVNKNKYRDSNGFIWTVDEGELVDDSGINIHYSYTIEQMVLINYIKEDQ